MRELEAKEALSALRSALHQVQSLVPYLRAELGEVPCAHPGHAALEKEVGDGVWLSCSELIEQPQWLTLNVRASGPAIGTADPMVAASIFVQGYSYRLLALAVASLLAGRVLPDSGPEQMAIRLSGGRPSHVAYSNPAVQSMSPGWELTDELDDALRSLLDRAVECHLRPLIGGLRRTIRVGERLLWGNVAASASVAFRTMEGCLGRWVIPVGIRFFELAPPDLHRQGSFLLMERGRRHGWFWERTNCCLYDRLPGNLRCSDCSRTPTGTRRDAYWASLVP